MLKYRSLDNFCSTIALWNRRFVLDILTYVMFCLLRAPLLMWNPCCGDMMTSKAKSKLKMRKWRAWRTLRITSSRTNTRTETSELCPLSSSHTWELAAVLCHWERKYILVVVSVNNLVGIWCVFIFHHSINKRCNQVLQRRNKVKDKAADRRKALLEAQKFQEFKRDGKEVSYYAIKLQTTNNLNKEDKFFYLCGLCIWQYICYSCLTGWRRSIRQPQMTPTKICPILWQSCRSTRRSRPSWSPTMTDYKL